MSSFTTFYAGNVRELGAAFRGLDPEDSDQAWPPFLVGYASCDFPLRNETALVDLANEARRLVGRPATSLSRDELCAAVGDAWLVPAEWIASLAALSDAHAGELARRWLALLSAAGANDDWIPDVEKFLSQLLPLCRLTIQRGCGMVYG